MRKHNQFRPTLNDRLEERVVLSTVSAVRVQAAATTRAQAIDAFNVQTQLNQAFGSFAQDFLNQELAYVNTPGASITDLQTYTTQRTLQLSKQIEGIIKASPNVPDGLVSYISNALNGTDADTLAGRLNAVKAVGIDGQTADQYVKDAQKSVDMAYKVTSATLSSFATAANQEQASAGRPYRGLKLTSAQVQRIKAQQGAQTKIQNAFNTFLTSFANARGTNLFAAATGIGTGVGTGTGLGTGTGATPSIDFAANRQAFDSFLSTSLGSLSSDLSKAFGNQRAAARSLLPSLQSAFMGTNAVDAQGNLNTGLVGAFNGLTTPTSTSGLSALDFNNNAFGLVNSAFQSTVNRSNALYNNPQFNFAPFPSFASDPFGPILRGGNVGTGGTAGSGSLGSGTGGIGGGTTSGGFGGSITSGGFNASLTNGGFNGFNSPFNGFGNTGFNNFFNFNNVGTGIGTTTPGLGTGTGIGTGTGLGTGTGIGTGTGTGSTGTGTGGLLG